MTNLIEIRHLEEDQIKEEVITEKKELIYSIEDVPPWYLSIFLGLQHYLTMFGGTVAIPYIICPALCMEENDPARGYIISTIFFVSGIITILQTTFGVRLPIIQGGTFSFLAPTFAILSLESNKCPADFSTNGWGNMTEENKTEEWQRRMREIQGAVAVSAIFQVLIGYLGIIGLLLKYITPLTIAPAIAMVGLSLFDVASHIAAKHWGVALGTIMTMILFSQYLRNVQVPCMSYNKDRGLHRSKMEIFQLFPVLFTILVMWGLCAILTVTDVFEPGNPARTDIKLELLQRAEWFRIPYPFQWGVPTVSFAGVFGMLAGVLASIIESIGDYYACARLSGAPPPPTHAINRGIGTEGVGCIIAGLWGTGNGTTSYSENIGAIGVTKVGSRRVIQFGGLIMIFFGLLSKFGSFFITIPEPIVGGIFCVMFGMITSVGLSNLQFVNLNSTRNLFVLGFSIFFSLALPKWMEENPNSINTGNQVVDQVVSVLLKTSMFVGGALGFFLDNTIPGSEEERGLTVWRELNSGKLNDENSSNSSCYDLPWGMTTFIKKINFFRYIPCSPTFNPEFGFTYFIRQLRKTRSKNMKGTTNKVFEDL